MDDELPMTIITNKHKLNDACLKEQVADPSAMQTKVSRDLSLTKQ
jgi:hypothetical protein